MVPFRCWNSTTALVDSMATWSGTMGLVVQQYLGGTSLIIPDSEHAHCSREGEPVALHMWSSTGLQLAPV